MRAALAHPGLCAEVAVGSPSYCFDPDRYEEIDAYASGLPKPAVFVAVGALEALGLKLKGNVHDGMVPGVKKLAEKLRARGFEVEGVESVAWADHSTIKLPFVALALGWFEERVMGLGYQETDQTKHEAK